MIRAFTPTELLAIVADGLDDGALFSINGSPAIFIDLDEPFDRDDLRRVARLLATAPVVGIGVSNGGPIDDPSAGDLDLLLCGTDAVERPWVGCGTGLAESALAIRASITNSPDAAVALAQLLRVGAASTATDAVIAESWVYSLLQGGSRYAQWLASRASRTPRPRPDSPVVRLERVGNVLHVTLDRPEVHNAFGTRMRDELVEAFRLADIDRTLDSIVVRGEGPSFCSGGDLDEFGTAPTPVEAHSVRTTRNAGIALAAVAERVEVLVHGTCVGAGVELPAFASRVVAHSSTTFRLPEISMGLVPGAGGTSSIPRRIGRHRAAFFALSGEAIDAQLALEWGLVDEIDDSRFTFTGVRP